MGKTVAGGPIEAADCGAGQARLQLASKEQLEDPARQKLVDLAVPHSHTDIPGGTKGEQNRPSNPGAPVHENKASNL